MYAGDSSQSVSAPGLLHSFQADLFGRRSEGTGGNSFVQHSGDGRAEVFADRPQRWIEKPYRFVQSDGYGS